MKEVAEELPDMGEQGLMRGASDGKAIRFEPGTRRTPKQLPTKKNNDFANTEAVLV